MTRCVPLWPAVFAAVLACGPATAHEFAGRLRSDDAVLGIRPQTAPPADPAAPLAKDYLDVTFGFAPGLAAGVGLHEFDGRPIDLSKARIDQYARELAKLKARVDGLIKAGAAPADTWQARQLRTAIDVDLFNIEAMKAYTRNPMTYVNAFDVNIYINRNYAPLEVRLAAALRILRSAPSILDAARANLDTVLPEVYIRTAVTNARGQAEFINGDLLTAFADIKDPQLRSELKSAAATAAGAMNAFAAWLESERLPKGSADFAIGAEAWARMVREQELIDKGPDAILELGLRELKRQQESFAASARAIDPSRPPAAVWAEVKREHPSADRLLDDARAHLEAIYQFLVQKDLISFPNSTRIIVAPMPEFERAGYFARCDTPGPFEKNAAEAYYYVTPPEKDWQPKRIEDLLAYFNDYTTDVVSIHEAYPGHFIQALHLNASSLDDWRLYLVSYAFNEGWAHYCEQMVLDEGFPPPALRTHDHAVEKYRMAQASQALLRVCRLVVSIKMHARGMDIDEAARFFVDNCYCEEPTGRNEAERGSFDPQYALYTVGKLQFLRLRDDWRAQEGAAFSLKRFHDELLRRGAPPIRLLRESMLKDPALWDASL